MKINFKSIALAALALLTISSCVKDQFDESLNQYPVTTIILHADKPGSFSVTKTGMEYDNKGFYRPFWEANDKIGVLSSIGSDNIIYAHRMFVDASLEPSVNSYLKSFKGEILDNSKVLYCYYPYKKDSHLPGKPTTINVDIPSVQYPGKDTFDGVADFLCCDYKPVEGQNNFSENLLFKRKTGFLKVVIDAKELLGEEIYSMTIKAESTNQEPVYVSGVWRYDLVTNSFGKIDSNTASNMITAMHDQGKRYIIDGKQNGTIFSLLPFTLTEGMVLTISGTTSKYKFSKSVTLQKPIQIVENELTVIGVRNLKVNSLTTNGEQTKSAWSDFETNKGTGILLDFSYAGFMHGEGIPESPDPIENFDHKSTYMVNGEKYTLFNVENYKTPERSDREAFMYALEAAGLGTVGTKFDKPYFEPKSTSAANVIMYFSGRDWILHNDEDNVKRNNGTNMATDSKGNNRSFGIEINAGHFLIKGAGKDKTRIIMQTPNLPLDSTQMYSSPKMIHLGKGANAVTSLNMVTNDAPRGSFTVSVDNSSGLVAGSWAKLSLNRTDAVSSSKLLPFEFGGHNVETWMSAIKKEVKVQEYHKIKEVSGKQVTFYEPIMREINCSRDGIWYLSPMMNQTTVNYYEYVGVEDLTFVGFAKPDFVHHASWKDDGAFKPLQFENIINGWLRNVDYDSISECTVFENCANCSAYNINIYGNRGHAGIRSMGSTRLFLGNIHEYSHGFAIVKGQKMGSEYFVDAGQYHASGVSKPAIGNVLWRNHWGKDATFESHSSQPRATLVDHCKGGWIEWRFGGHDSELPNHLGDLTIWNMNAERFYGRPEQQSGYQFWDTRNSGEKWRVTPPIVVGFHGSAVVLFDTSSDQIKHFESYGTPVSPESLYESQLDLRLQSKDKHVYDGNRKWYDFLQGIR